MSGIYLTLRKSIVPNPYAHVTLVYSGKHIVASKLTDIAAVIMANLSVEDAKNAKTAAPASPLPTIAISKAVVSSYTMQRDGRPDVKRHDVVLELIEESGALITAMRDDITSRVSDSVRDKLVMRNPHISFFETKTFATANDAQAAADKFNETQRPLLLTITGVRVK